MHFILLKKLEKFIKNKNKNVINKYLIIFK